MSSWDEITAALQRAENALTAAYDALLFYANKQNYQQGWQGDPRSESSEVDKDQGARARNALGMKD